MNDVIPPALNLKPRSLLPACATLAMVICACDAPTASAQCAWEDSVYVRAMRVIGFDSLNARKYGAGSAGMRFAVWDTAVAFSGLGYDDFDVAPASCAAGNPSPEEAGTAPCRSFALTGFRRLSSSASPSFLVKFSRIDSARANGGYLVIAFLWPVHGDIAPASGEAGFADMVAYVFCFDGMAVVRNVKRIDPQE